MAGGDTPYNARKPEGDQRGDLVSAIIRLENQKKSTSHRGTPAWKPRGYKRIPKSQRGCLAGMLWGPLTKPVSLFSVATAFVLSNAKGQQLMLFRNACKKSSDEKRKRKETKKQNPGNSVT